MRNLLLLFSLLTLAAAPAWAHNFWLKPDAGGAVLFYGHHDESDAYEAKVVKSVGGWGADGKKKEVTQTFQGVLKLSGAGISTWAVEIDNGYWTKTIQGWKKKSKREQTKYIKSTWDRAFSKLVGAKNLDQVVGHPLEIVLSSASAAKIDGQVLLRGKPAAGITLERDHKKIGSTGADGKFSVKGGGKGLAVVKAHYDEKLEGNPDADILNLDATLTVNI